MSFEPIEDAPSSALRLLVFGSRTFADYSIVLPVLDGFWAEATVGYLSANMNGMTLIEGGAPGADSIAKWWALNSPMHSYNESPDHPPFEHLPFWADWNNTIPREAAGPIRNQQMIDEGRPNLAIAFIDKPLTELKGTPNMIGKLKAAGVKTYVVQAVN